MLSRRNLKMLFAISIFKVGVQSSFLNTKKGKTSMAMEQDLDDFTQM